MPEQESRREAMTVTTTKETKRKQAQTDVLRTKDGFAWQPVAEIGAHDNRSVAQMVKDSFDEAVVACIQDGGFSYDELATRLRHIQRAGIKMEETND
jgi:ribosome-binding protein aMBF1 (putative translation factor)